MHRFYPLLRVFGALLIGFSLCLLVPMGLSWYVADGAHTAFDTAFLATLLSGSILFLGLYREAREMKVRDGFLLVVLVWTVLPLFACLPFIIQLGISPTDAYFEAMSGLTATGATVLSGLDQMPLSINFWRTFMHWIGGMGVVVLAVAILPLLGIGGRQMFKAEVPGPMKEASLTPRIAETAKGLWRVYLLLTIACGLTLWQLGMEPWDALMHAFSVLGLGGFSSKDASLGHFNSLEIELAVMFFALLSGINYATHFMALHGRSLNPYRKDAEAPYFLGVLAASILALSIYLWSLDVFSSFGETLRYVAFHTISLATSLGLATADYGQWPFFAQIWMLFLGSFIACSGSTGGGIKMIRAMILYKQVYRELICAMHPSALWPVRIKRSVVPQNVLSGVMAFGFIYMVSIVSLTLLMSFTGLDIVTSFSAVVACINNTGPGLNLVGPSSNFSVLTDFQTWVCTFAMLLGRLEIFTLLVVLTPAFWRK
ncbi:MAG: TrkH family potassium uptake protein [Gammaproteobacteria bacterium]|nr:TrkH family potassium uptake protein [Rhodocyclaceae bacterium]MBU3909254.1 TrkH family potassium uptake protein [Gammaproteobacteria bacterium]MBU3989638.1 TrkH family potassium uptake protein [Gammaproteobacteria bacterium]MBU4005586.1 TrkH family potassium uptake protein [Gammaproteobacteria bacterium]MBU4020861.1 TrkH family potassium uptake protein [Gammaproteobacteria bacterium]